STITRNQGGSTVSGRSGPIRTGGGGGIAVVGAVTLHNTLVAGNVHGDELFLFSPPDDIHGLVAAASTSNLIGTGGSRGLTHGTNGNLVGIADPLLAPLADNGGPTLTHALLGGSPAINAGNNAQASGDSDQRGVPRRAGARVDIGAVEQVAFIAGG